MRWLALSVLASACTAANPAFDLVDGSAADDAPGSLEAGEAGPESSAGDGEGESTTEADPDCGPFDAPAKVELTIDGAPICGEFYAITGFVESVTPTELRINCDENFDSDCIPGALGVLTVGYGLPPELVADPSRTMQLQYATDANCEFAMTRLQPAEEQRETFLAVGAPAIFAVDGSVLDWHAEIDHACDCFTLNCCELATGTYRLLKESGGENLSLAEGEEAQSEVDGMIYRFANVAAHVKRDCTKVFHWQSVQVGS